MVDDRSAAAYSAECCSVFQTPALYGSERVTVGPPRKPEVHGLPYVPFDSLPGALQDLLRPRYERLGYLGEFFQVAAHQPDALVAFHRFSEELKAALPDRFTELVALTVSSRLGNHYERNQHEQLATKLGFSVEWIADALAGDPSLVTALADDERVAQRLALAAVSGQAAPEVVGDAADVLGPQVTVGLLLLVGRYVAHSAVVRTLGLLPPVPPVVSVP